MKYSKADKRAINALWKMAWGLRYGTPVTLRSSERTALKTALGIDLGEITLPKSKVKSWVRGKDEVLVKVSPAASPWAGLPDTFCYFPFQVRERRKS